MELNQLKAFVAVADQGSFSLAAETLFLTQPAVSKRLAALENELDIRLFQRIGKQVRLTHAGEKLLPKARELLLQAQDLKYMASNLQQHVQGRLVFGTSHHIGLHRLPPILKAFRKRFSDVELDIHFLDSEAACRAVEKGELELAIVTLPQHPGNTLQCHPLWNDPLLFVAAHQHPLAQRDSVSIAMLTEYPAVLPGPTTFTRAILEQALSDYNLALRSGMSSNYLETIKMLTDINLGWSLLPATMVDEGLAILPVPLQLSRTLGVVIHDKRSLSNPAHALMEMLPCEPF